MCSFICAEKSLNHYTDVKGNILVNTGLKTLKSYFSGPDINFRLEGIKCTILHSV